MAREVIADIDFGDEMASASLGRVGQSINRLESQTVRSANVFTNRMFSMRTAAMAFLGGFTIAGAILAFKSFIESAAKGDPAFKSMAASATEMSNAWMEAARATPGFHLAIQGIDSAFLHLAAGAKMFKALMTKDAGDFVEEYIKGLKEVEAEQRKILAGGGFDPFKFAGIPKPGELDAAVSSTRQALKAIDASFAAGKTNAAQYAEAFNNLKKKLVEMGASQDDLTKAGILFVSGAAQQVTVMGDLADKAEEATVKFQILQLTIQQGADLIANALAGNVTSFRLFIRSVLIEMAKMLIVEGIGNLAKGFAASATPFGAAAASFYYHAAKLDFLGAALAGGAARAVGGGAGGGGSVSPNRSPGLGPGLPEARQMIINNHITIEGNADPSTVDLIIDAISERLKDGVSGGNFNGQLARA